MANKLEKILNKIRTPLISTLAAASLFISTELKNQTEPYKDGKISLTYNVIAIRANEEADKNNALANFEKTSETIIKELKKTYRWVNYEFHVITVPDTIRVNSTQRRARGIKVKNQIDSLFTSFYEKHGQIDRALLGFHGHPENIILARTTYKDLDKKNSEYTTLRFVLTGEEIINIAKQNEKAKELFKENGKILMYSCHSGRHPEKSAALATNKGYNVEVHAPKTRYMGGITYNKEISDIVLRTKNKSESTIKVTVYKKEGEEETYLYIPERNRTISLESLENIDLIKKYELENYEPEQIKFYLELQGYKNIKENVSISKYMDIKIFEKPHKKTEQKPLYFLQENISLPY